MSRVLTVCPLYPFRLFVCPSASSVYLIACLPVRPFARLSVCPSVCLPVCSVCLPAWLPIHSVGSASPVAQCAGRDGVGPGIRCEAERRWPVARRWSSDTDARIRMRGYGCADTDVRMRMCGCATAAMRWRGAVAPAGDAREPGHRHRCMASVHEQPPGAARSRPSTRCFALYTGCGIITKAIFGHWP